VPEQLSAEQAALLGRLVDVHPEARELGELFAAAGHELHLVGGTVRDTLIADASRVGALDLDFATSARPEETEAIVRGWASAVWLTGAAFGTVACQRDEPGRVTRPIEITTFRADVYEAGSRHPEVTYSDTIEADLARRDFTVNAMAVRVPDFSFIDPHGGIGDLRARLLRTPVDPHVSFADDPLRLVRLARFAAVLEADVEQSTLAAAREMAGEIVTVSRERVRDELVRLMTGASPRRGLDLLITTGLADHVLPELVGLHACVDPDHLHKDVYAHTLGVIDNAIAAETDGPDLVLRLAALFHDVGKPATKEVVQGGKVTFHTHDVVGARMTRERMRELRFDKQLIKDVSELVRLHLRLHTFEFGWTDSAVRRYVRDAGALLERLNLLTRADVTTGNPRRAAAIQRRVDELEERVAALRAQEEIDALRPPIDGRRIMAHLRIAPGPLVGRAWEHLLELRIEQGPMDEDAALAALDAWWADNAPDPGGR